MYSELVIGGCTVWFWILRFGNSRKGFQKDCLIVGSMEEEKNVEMELRKMVLKLVQT